MNYRVSISQVQKTTTRWSIPCTPEALNQFSAQETETAALQTMAASLVLPDTQRSWAVLHSVENLPNSGQPTKKVGWRFQRWFKQTSTRSLAG